MRIRRLWTEVVGPVDAWEQDTVSTQDSLERFEWLEFQESADSWNAEGVRLANSEDYDGALSACEKAKVFNPSSSVIRSNLSRIHLRKDDVNNAILELTEACRLAPGDVDYSRRLAALYAKSGNLEDAEKEFLRATLLSPDEVEIWLELYNSFIMTKRLADAVRTLALAIERFPDDKDLCDLMCACLSQLAYTQVAAGDRESAEANLSAACKAGSSWRWAKAWIWIARSSIRLAQGHPFKACFCIVIAYYHLAVGTCVDWAESTREVWKRWKKNEQNLSEG